MNRITAIALAIVSTATLLIAQATTGTISGTVSDESGGVVPNTKISITNKATGLGRELLSRPDGSFFAAALSAGEYDVRAEAAGFRAMLRGATVETGTTTTVNLQLQVGATKDVVSVEAAAANITYDSYAVQGVVSRKQIQDLPLNGRSFMALAQLEPGVIVTPSNPAQFNAQFNVSILGGPASHTAVSVDGANIRNPVEGGSGQNFSQEIVQEFQLSSVNFDLSTGLTAFGSINVVTRSGGNNLHGAAFFFFRDHNMSAYPSLNRNALTNDPYFARKQTGFWLSGPLKKDKLFFFGNFEYTNQTGVYVVQADLPSLAFFNSVSSAPYRGKQLGMKLDYHINEKHNAFFRYSHDGNTNAGPFGTPVPQSNFVSNSNWVDQFTLGITSVVSPSIVNDLRFSYWYWQNRNAPAPCAGCPGAGGPEIFFAGISSNNIQLGNNFNSPQGRDLRRYPLTDSVTWQKGTHRLKFGGDFEFNRGTGYWGFFDPARAYLLSPETLGGLGGAASYGLTGGVVNSFADILKLPVATYLVGVGVRDQPAPFQLDQARPNTRVHFYAQDTWRVTPKFTLNYGAGWVYESNLLNFDLKRPAFLTPLYGSNLEAPAKNYKNFSPALGFAWNVGKHDRTVIRGGSGIFYDTQLGWWRLGERASLGPNGRQYLTTSVPVVTAAGVYRYTYGQFLNDLPSIIKQNNAVLPGTGTTPQIQIAKQAGALGALYPHDFPTLQAQHFNIGVQHKVGAGVVVTADFAFRHTIHQTPGGFFGASVDYNHFNAVTGPVIPKCPAAQAYDPSAQCSNGPITFWYPGSNATYRAFLLKVDKRFAHHYQFTGSYALQNSKSVNNVSQNLFNYNSSYGPDLPRHNLNLSGIVETKWGIQMSLIASFVSRPPVQPFISGVDITGSDYTTGGVTILPGMSYNQFLSTSDLSKLVDQYNTTYAGKPTPAATAGISPTQVYPKVTLPNHFHLGFPFQSEDLRITKAFRFKEKYEARFIGEGFNMFNVGNLTGATNLLTSPSFGQAQQRIGQTFGTGGPRAFQVALRLQF